MSPQGRNLRNYTNLAANMEHSSVSKLTSIISTLLSRLSWVISKIWFGSISKYMLNIVHFNNVQFAQGELYTYIRHPSIYFLMSIQGLKQVILPKLVNPTFGSSHKLKNVGIFKLIRMNYLREYLSWSNGHKCNYHMPI